MGRHEKVLDARTTQARPTDRTARPAGHDADPLARPSSPAEAGRREPGSVVVAQAGGSGPLQRRALALWPRLDAPALRRCGDDPRRIARLVARRTPLSVEVIVVMLLTPSVSAQEAEFWFG